MPKRRQKIISDNEIKKSRKVKDRILSVQEKEENILSEQENSDDQEERKNKLIMWIGISCIMAVFFIAWIFTLKYEFKASLNKRASGSFNWNQTKAELADAMAKVKLGIAEVKQIQKETLSNSPQQSELSVEQIKLLKGKLLNEVASTTETTASGTINIIK